MSQRITEGSRESKGYLEKCQERFKGISGIIRAFSGSQGRFRGSQENSGTYRGSQEHFRGSQKNQVGGAELRRSQKRFQSFLRSIR